MSWLQLNVDLRERDPTTVEDVLHQHDALAITLSDAGDQPLLEPGVGETPLWREVTLTALFDAGADATAIEAALAAAMGTTPDCRWQTLEDRAWERAWLERFGPQRFGHRLWVIPGDSEPVDPAAANVKLDPGLAFGTGDHETTAMCLQWLGDCADIRGLHVLDYGCGSGILAIAALKLGAAHAVAVDNDPQALQATRDNAMRNGVFEQIDIRSADTPMDARFDIVVANILAGPLVALAPRIAAAVAPGGRLVLSGILADQAAEVADAYAHAIDWQPASHRADWVRLNGCRRSAA